MGVMGWFHASQYARLDGIELTAIADVDPARLEAREEVIGNITREGGSIDLESVARYTDASALIAEAGVDLVDVCLPTYLHAHYTIEALEAGRHVLCEKPMALTLEDADRMVDASERAKRRLMIAQCVRFWPEYMHLRQVVREGTYGKLLSLNMYRIGGRPVWSPENWFLDPARSGGPIRDLHIHDVDYVHSLLGAPDRVQAVGRRSEPTGSYDVIHAVYSYDTGPQVHLHAGWSMAQVPFQAGYDAWFERGFLRYDPKHDPPLIVFDDLVHVNGHPAEYERGNAYYNEIAYFCACVADDAFPAECPPRSARGSLALIEREIASIESGETVREV
jgi:predicted dehydrogenase